MRTVDLVLPCLLHGGAYLCLAYGGVGIFCLQGLHRSSIGRMQKGSTSSVLGVTTSLEDSPAFALGLLSQCLLILAFICSPGV